MAEIDVCPNCNSILFSIMDPKSGKEMEHWDNRKKQKVKVKYKKITYRCEVCDYKFKDDEVHYGNQ